MPRVHFVEKARKDNPVAKKGESYYWWQFRFGGKRYSKTRPKPSQLTQSDFLSQAYEIQERIAEMSPLDFEDIGDIECLIEEIVGDIENLGSEQEDKLSNMPDQLQDSDTGQLLQERIEAMENWASELQEVVGRIDELTIEEMIEELQSVDCGV